MHFPKKENTLSQHNTTQQRWQPTPRRSPGAAWPWHTAGRQWVREGRKARDRREEVGVFVSLLTTAVECSMLSCCQCVCVCLCICAVHGESVKSWCAHRSICHPHIVYLVAAAAESLPQFLHPSLSLCPITAPALFALCVPTNLINLCKK